MGSFRTKWRWLRPALAGLLVVVSLVQMPSMVMAWSGSGAAYHEHSVASHDHHPTLQPSRQHHPERIADAFEADADTHGTFSCHAVGCCLALNPGVCRAASAFDQLLGPVDAPAARVMVSAMPDPPDPPPRLQV